MRPSRALGWEKVVFEMTPGGWRVFREIYLRIILSVLTVTAAMLMLQNSLNQLKLRSLAAEATSSRLQISAATIESAIVRAEALGLAMDEMAGLQDLLDRERARDASLAQIAIVSPIGVPILASGDALGDMEPILRRVLSGREKTALVDAGEALFTGRVVFDSSNAVMGAVILTTPTELYLGRAYSAFGEMNRSYLIIFGLVAAVLIPFILFQFRGVSTAFRALDPARIGAGPPAGAGAADADVSAAIAEGDRQVAAAEAELAQMLRDSSPENPATEPQVNGVKTNNDPQTSGHVGRDIA